MAINFPAVKACWEAATWNKGTPLSLSRWFWIKRTIYYLFGGK